MADIAELGLKVDSKGVKQGAKALKDLSGAAGKAERSIGQVSSASSALNKVLGLTAGYLSARAIIQASDQYGQMAARIKMATASTEEYVKVQARLLDTANNTYRALGEAQELYIRTADAIRSLGYNTDEVLDITDSFSYLLVTNAASADRASSAISAYSKAIATGKVDADTWQSILAATPTIVDDIAAATGRSTDEVRKFGIQGKLSLTALNEALLQSRDRNEELAASMETSVQDATTALSNSFQVFVGKVNETSGASSILTDNIGELAEILQDPETIRAAQEMAAGVVAALNTIIKTAKETVGVVKWAAESAAAFMNGIAADDVVRLNDELVRLQEMKKGGALDKLVFFGRDGIVSYYNEAELDAEIAKIQAAIAQAMVGAPQTPGSGGAPKKNRGVKPPLTGSDNGTGKGLTDRIGEQIAQLEFQAATVGMTSDQVTLLKLSLDGATESQIAQASAALGTVAAYEAQAKAAEEAARAKEKAGAGFDRVSMELGASGSGNADIDALMVKYQERQSIISEALATEYITQQQHDEAMLLLDQQTADARKQILADYTAAQQAQQLQSMAAIVSITQSQISQMQGLFEEGTAIGKAFFVATQALAAANAIVQGFQSAMAIRVAYAQMAAMSGPGAPALLAAGEVHANVAQGMGFVTAGMIAAQTVSSFDGGGYTGNGSRTGGVDGKGGFWAVMHPQETVIDHTKGQSMGGTIINIIESKDRAGTQQQRQGADGREEVDVFVADIMGDGKRARALQAAFGLQRRGV